LPREPYVTQQNQEKIQQQRQALSTCMLQDRRRLSKRLHHLSRRLKQGKAIEQGLSDVAQKISQSTARYKQRLAALPTIVFPEDLPISAKRESIAAAIEKHQVLIVAGETGSGKTTQIPKICLQLGRGVAGFIGHTQPRRIAARSVATRIAQELKSKMGEYVGYKVRFTDKSQKNGYIKLMTDGILLAEMQSDALFEQYDTIIIDEAHERSLNIDFLLGYLKRLLPKRPDLKVIITSATINTASFSKFFDDAPVIEVSGRSYPVDVLYEPIVGDDDAVEQGLPQAIVAAVDDLQCLDAQGDVLVFLPGEREIREAAHALEQHSMKNTEILPLFSRLSAAEQDRVFQSHRGRRIVLATNVAETSLTVPGIRFVIDSGLARISRYSARTKVQRLPIEAISQASANQRAGRCGRIAAGICIRLYGEDSFNQRPEQTDAEILRTNLASVILHMSHLGLGDVAKFPFMNPPESRSISDGYRLLHELQAVDEQRKLTDIGKKLVRLPVDPRLGRMLLQAKKERSLREVLIIVSALSVQDPRARPMDAQQKADEKHRLFLDESSDFMAYLKLWDWYHGQAKIVSKTQLRKQCQKHYISYIRMREWHDLHAQLLTVVKDFNMQPNDVDASSEEVHRALLAGLLGHIAVQDEAKRYLGARNLKLSLFPASALYKKPPKWLMAGTLMETSKLYARTLAAIDPTWLESLAPHLIQRSYSEPHWSAKRAQVMAYERVSLYGLTLIARRLVAYHRVDAVLSRELFIRHALVLGEYRAFGKYAEHNRRLIKEVETLEAKARRRDLLADEQVRFEFFDALIAEHLCSGKTFEKWRKQEEIKNPKLLFLNKDTLLANDNAGLNRGDFPDTLSFAGQSLRVSYHFDPSHHADGITLLVPKAVLGQIEAEVCEWLVPGMLQEKLIGLIKSLPKQLRRNFVPANEFAAAAMQAMLDQGWGKCPLLVSFSQELERMTGVHIAQEQWNMEKIPAYLFMNFRVLDKNKRKIEESSNLQYLKQKFSAKLALSSINKFEKFKINEWGFGDVPKQLSVPIDGLQVQRFPALQDQSKWVDLRLFEQPQQAELAMRKGVCRLLMLAMQQQVALLHQKMQKMPAMMMQAALLGSVDKLRDDVAMKVFEDVFLSDSLDSMPRSQAEFEAVLAQGRGRVVAQGEQLIKQLDTIFQSYAKLQQDIQNSCAIQKKAMIEDVKKQCDSLVYDGFVEKTPMRILMHLPRFLAAARLRIEKSGQNLTKDAQNTQQIDYFWQKYEQKRHLLLKSSQPTAALDEFRWMIEELRVALFAQSLKTSMPTSVQRLEKYWQSL